MPYAPTERNQIPQIISQTAGDLQQALRDYDERKRKDQFTQGAFDALQADPSAKKYITPEILTRFAKANPDQRAGLLASLGGTIQADRQTQLAQMGETARAVLQRNTIAAEADSRAAQAERDRAEASHVGDRYNPGRTEPVPYKDPSTGENVPGLGIIPMTGQLVRDPRTPPTPLEEPDKFGRYWDGKKWTQLRKDAVPPLVAAATATRQLQIDGLTQKIAEQEAEVAKGDLHTGFANLQERSKIIAGLTAQRAALLQDPTAESKATPTPSPTPAAKGAASGMNGYLPGRRYAGKLYMGGDPNLPENWQ